MTTLPNVKTCSVDGCDQVHRAKGLCYKHYLRKKKNGSVDIVKRVPTIDWYNRRCTIAGCDAELTEHSRKGMCVKHYWRYTTYGDASFTIRPTSPQFCKYDGCGRKIKGLGYCSVHYQRYTKNGTPELVKNDIREIETSVYRMYDKSGTLIYVGISCDAGRRLSQHKAQKTWWREVDKITIRKYASRAEAERIERRAILKYNPVHNKARYELVSREARILQKKGRSNDKPAGARRATSGNNSNRRPTSRPDASRRPSSRAVRSR